MEFLLLDSSTPLFRIIRKLVFVLREGGVIAYPTDTVYGLGCDLHNRKALERLYQAKRLRHHKPLSFICADLKGISRYARVTDLAYKVMHRLLPGPFTFILPATREVPKIMLPHQKTVGIRIPDNEICLGLVKELGNPIVSTSASLGEEKPLSEPAEIETLFSPYLDALLDAGPLPNVPSTVIDLTGQVPVLVREGKGDASWLS